MQKFVATKWKLACSARSGNCEKLTTIDRTL